MRIDIIHKAISERKQLQFKYGSIQIILEPYYLSTEKNNKKFIYGRVKSSNEIKRFESDKIKNLRILNLRRFSPIIPITEL